VELAWNIILWTSLYLYTHNYKQLGKAECIGSRVNQQVRCLKQIKYAHLSLKKKKKKTGDGKAHT